ncbi:hypothetical protein BSKO_06780 [Bryopsis sp. KO-2023]|nr:hypothetical protein BSKO_06780 [Bryopsis sp. KO-2023]
MSSDSDSDDLLIAGPGANRGEGFFIKEVGHRQFRAICDDGEDPPNPSAALDRTVSVPITPVGDENLADTRSKEERKEEILRLLKQSMGTVLTHKQKALAEVVKEAAAPQRPKLRKRNSVPLSEAPSSRGLLMRVTSAPDKAIFEDEDADVRKELVSMSGNLKPRVLTSVNKVRKVVAETSPDVSENQAQPAKGLAMLQVSSGTSVSPGSLTLTPGASISMPLIEFDELRNVKEMGRGQFAKVWLCTWRGVNVAMKEQHGFDEESLTNAVKEAETLAALRHPYVLSFYGMVTNGPFPAHIMEYMVHGSLKDKLKELRKGGIGGMKLKASIALQAARGMDFLHSRKIIHFDLKCANLLCDLQVLSNPIVKIGDVGLSKEKLRTFVSGNMRGTLPWMAPELFPSPGDLGGSVLDRVDEKVDVYSFGVVLWEIWTMGMDPYPGLDSTELLFGIMGRTLKLDIPDDCDKDWASLIEHCTELDSCLRPTFEEIAASLEHITNMASEDTSEVTENSPFVDPNFVHYSSTATREFLTAETNQYFSAEGPIV